MKNFDFDQFVIFLIIVAIAAFAIQVPSCIRHDNEWSYKRKIEALKNGCSIINYDYYCNGEIKKIYEGDK